MKFVPATIVALLGFFAQTSLSDSCSTHSNCSSCASTSGCMWVLLYNCMEECIRTDYSDPEGIKMKNVIWRSEVRNETLCPNKEECEIMEGNVPNPSFEDWSWKEYSNKVKNQKSREGETIHDPWIFARIISVENCTSITNRSYDECRKTYYTGFDGDFFLYMGGASIEGNVITYEVRLDNDLKISKNATHLSFFYALPYYSDISKSVHFYPFKDRTALDVFIDGEHVFRLDNKSINETMYRESGAFYHPMNIDVSGFADDNEHSLILYFTEEKYIIDPINASNNPIQAIFIDYVQVIKSNLNGSTFDGWEGAPFSSKTSCETYCHSEYIGDGVCDRVCLTNECKNDGGDCEYGNDLSTEAVLGIVFGVIGGLIIVVIILLIVLFYLIKKPKTGGGGGGIEVQNTRTWTVNTKNIVFGGKEADIGIALTDTLSIANYGKPRTFAVSLHEESRCNSDMRYKVTINPKQFELKKYEEQTVNITIKIFCTMTITERLEARIVNDKNNSFVESEFINLVASGKKSTRINPYDITLGKVIGNGSYGIVYRGLYKKTYDVAIKKLQSADDSAVADFNNEADILEKINSEYVVKFYGAIVTDEHYCFVSEFAPFKSLDTCITSSSISPYMRMRYLCDISRGMEYLHEINIIHRDLKPGNILCFNIVDPLSTKPVCKISDFGGSKILHETTEVMTKGMGTFTYMAPEILNGGKNYNKSVDVFSFGIMISEIVTGLVPYENFKLTHFKRIEFIMSGGRPTIPSNMTPKLKDLMIRCWNTEPSVRPTFTEIRTLLESIGVEPVLI